MSTSRSLPLQGPISYWEATPTVMVALAYLLRLEHTQRTQESAGGNDEHHFSDKKKYARFFLVCQVRVALRIELRLLALGRAIGYAGLLPQHDSKCAMRVTIPRPFRCKRNALPTELIAQACASPLWESNPSPILTMDVC